MEDNKINVEKDEEPKIVIPGECLVEGMNYLPGKGTFRSGEKICSKYLGLLKIKESLVNVLPLGGVYLPRVGDKIIGQIIDIQRSMWYLEINSPYNAALSVADVNEYIDTREDITRYHTFNDVLYAKVVSVSKSMFVGLSMRDPMCKKLRGGRIISITPSKVPRLIGKDGSMIHMVKEKTGCFIVVGQNGLVWIKDGDENLATQAIKIIESESHTRGLTDRVMKFLTEHKKVTGVEKNEDG